jgi:uncharacterized protein YjiK
MKINILFFCNFLLVSIGCGNDSNDKPNPVTDSTTYHLSKPDKTIYLAGELEEVSDISYVSDGNLVCVQDEKGIIYEIDPSGEIILKNVFEGSGDFEGLTVKGETAYAVTSRGEVYEIKNFHSKTPEIRQYQTSLNETNNVEGACYDKSIGKILLVCKDHPGAGLDRREYKAVYSYNPGTHTLDEKPFMEISIKKIKNFIEKRGRKGSKKGNFHPSGIAIHPLTGHYFIIASAGKLMVELDERFQIVEISDLPEQIFIQPEGIAFNEEGDLYISNEGKGGRASVLYFQVK